MVLRSVKNTKIGDIVVFNVQSNPDPIIHRVVNIKEQKFYKTKGDHNCGSDVYEQSIPKQALLGKAWFRIPLLGWVKIIFIKLISPIITLFR